MKKDTEKTFCILPFMHFYTQPDGEVKPCCIAAGFDNKQSLHEKSIEEIFNSKDYKQLRKDMLDGKRNKVCDVCYKKEDAGENSPRHFFNSTGVWDIPKINKDYSVPVEFQHIDIRFSNLCNFKCRMCNHTFSSHWYEDAQKITLHKTLPYLAGNKKVIEASDTIIEDIIPYIKKLKSVYFAGGEPLINDQHYELLDWLYNNVKEVEEDGRVCKDMLIHYNTNLSTLKYKNYNFIKYWKEFRKVNLSISCDGVGKVGEYQRVGFKHDTFIKNLNELKKHAKPNSTLSLDQVFCYNFQYTTTIFNVEHIFDFIDFMIDNEYIESTESIDFYYAWGPSWVDIQNIPIVHKKRITEMLLEKIELLSSDKTKNELMSIVNHMNSLNNSNTGDVIYMIKQMDGINKTDYRDITNIRFDSKVKLNYS